MAKTKPTTVDLGGPSVQREAIAGGAITPGMTVILNSSGLLVAGPAAGITGPAAFAVENDMIGKGMEDAYAQGDQVIYRVFAEGAHVNAILASGANINAGVLLQTNGSGKLITASTADAVVAKSLEAINASGGDKRIRVEICKGQVPA